MVLLHTHSAVCNHNIKNHVEPYHILCFLLQYHMYACDGIIKYGMEQYGTIQLTLSFLKI